MLKNPNVRHILFYIVATASVVTLFNLVTAYALANLKAPLRISGVYEIEAKSFSPCLKEDSVLLKIQQSGLYLNALIVPISQEKRLSSDETFPLIGHFDAANMTIKGNLSELKGCPSADAQGQVIIKATAIKGQKIDGVITSGSLTVPFTAVARVEQKSDSKKPH